MHSDLHASLKRNMVMGLVTTGLFLSSFVGWAATAQLSSAVISSGYLVVEGNAKQVQHPEGGVIAALAVREGDHVTEGQVVARLDATQIDASLQATTHNLNQLYARRARLEAEIANADRVALPAELAGRLSASRADREMQLERRLFSERKMARENARARFDGQLLQLHQEESGLNQQILAKNAELALVEREGETQKALLAKKLVSSNASTDIARYLTRLKAEIGQTNTQLAATRGKMEEVALQKLQVTQQMLTEDAGELRDIDNREAELVGKESAARDALERTAIRAPIAGLVHKLSVHTTGGVIRPAETLMEIVPEHRDLIVQAKIAPAEIERLTVGQPAQLRLTAFNAATTPELNGRLLRVSADLETDERSGQAFYLADIAVSSGEESRLGGRPLLPGMPAEVFISTGDRLAMSWLLKPIQDHAARVFREE